MFEKKKEKENKRRKRKRKTVHIWGRKLTEKGAFSGVDGNILYLNMGMNYTGA